MIVELFAGPGGWSEGLRICGRSADVAVEVDPSAVAVAVANGHPRLRGDVYGLDPRRVAPGATGVVASPPCGGLSGGGLQLGKLDLTRAADLLLEIVDAHQEGAPDPRADFLMGWEDLRSPLLAEPMRWVLQTDARWLVLEQVEEAEWIWEEYAGHLAALGWEGVDVRVVDAADYGVPQERRRAILVAHRYSPVTIPDGEAHPVPASTVVGPGMMGFPRRADRGATVDIGGVAYRARDLRSTDRPSFTLTGKARSVSIVAPDGTTRRLSLAEAGQLQSFPADYRWDAAGSPSDGYQRIADAVPPLLAAAVLREVLDADDRVKAWG